MTREIRPRSYPDGRSRTPKYIDHGHTGRKVVFYTVCVLVVPLAFTQALANRIDEALDTVGHWVNRLRVWSHPCLYAPRPKRPAPELSPDWKARLDDDSA